MGDFVKGTPEGLARNFRRVAARSPRLGPVRDACIDLETHHESLGQAFDRFFPDARRRARELRGRPAGRARPPDSS